jgi:hypothetical protein
MLEKKINEVFGDDDLSGFGTGWWSGVPSAFFGILAFGAVVCLHFPQLLSSPELRQYYQMDLIRMTIQVVIIAMAGCNRPWPWLSARERVPAMVRSGSQAHLPRPAAAPRW